jgi:hypothetical protein
MSLFRVPKDKVLHDSITSEMPNGIIWVCKRIVGKYLYALMFGAVAVFKKIREMIALFAKELDINTTTELIDLWEESVGLPDDATANSVLTIEERRTAIIQRLSKVPRVTLEEIQTLLDDLYPGVGITILTGEYLGGGFPYTFRMEFTQNYGDRNRFVLEVIIPENAIVDIEQIRSYLTPVIPSNVLLLITEQGSEDYTYITTFNKQAVSFGRILVR